MPMGPSHGQCQFCPLCNARVQSSVFLSCTASARHVDWSVRIARFYGRARCAELKASRARPGYSTKQMVVYNKKECRHEWAVVVDKIYSCDPRDAMALIDACFGEQFSRLVK
jgi:hypothetical protein